MRAAPLLPALAVPAIIFVFHSSNGTPQEIRTQFGYQLDRRADKDGAIVVYPKGFQNHWNDCRKQAPYRANTQNIDDVGFVEMMVTWFSKHYTIDQKKIYATGLSNGGNFALRLALETSNFQAVAAIGTNLPTKENFDCQHTEKPRSFLLMNGTCDPINPYNGGMVSLYGLGKRGTVLSSHETIRYWLNNAKISSMNGQKKVHSIGNTRSTHEQWTKENTLISLITVQGGGHNIPGPSKSTNPIFGPKIKTFWGADIIYDFFIQSSQLKK